MSRPFSHLNADPMRVKRLGATDGAAHDLCAHRRDRHFSPAILFKIWRDPADSTRKASTNGRADWSLNHTAPVKTGRKAIPTRPGALREKEGAPASDVADVRTRRRDARFEQSTSR